MSADHSFNCHLTESGQDHGLKSATKRREKRKVAMSVRFTEPKVVSTIPASSKVEESEQSSIWFSEDEINEFKFAARATSKRFRVTDRHRKANEDSITSSDGSIEQKQAMRKMLHQQSRKDKMEVLANLSKMPLMDCSEYDKHVTNFSVPRGLEQRISFLRQWKKFLAVRSVLECQRQLRALKANSADTKLPNSDFLARVAIKSSQWARDIALATGQTDFLEVQPNMAQLVYVSPTSHLAFPGTDHIAAPPTRKRQRSDTSIVSSTSTSEASSDEEDALGGRRVRSRTAAAEESSEQLHDFLNSSYSEELHDFLSDCAFLTNE